MRASPTSPDSLLSAAFALASAGALSAQGEAVKGTFKAKIDKAIKDYQAIRSDAKKLTQRRKLLGWLGEIDHPRVTKHLQTELRRLALPERHLRHRGDGQGRAPRRRGRPVQGAQAAGRQRLGADRGHARSSVTATRRPKRCSSSPTSPRTPTRVAASSRGCRAATVEIRRQLAELIVDGEHEHRRYMLLNTATIKGDAKIDRVREQRVKEGDPLVASTAWRILAEQGARALPPTSTSSSASTTCRTRSRPSSCSKARVVGDADFFPALLRFGSVRGGGVKQALKVGARSAAKQPELIEFLIEEGLESESTPERNAAKILLSEAPASALQPLVAKMRKQLKRNRKKVLDTAAGLHELLAKDPTWCRTRGAGRRRRLREPGAGSVAAARDELARGDHVGAEVPAQPRVERSLAFRYLAKNRDVTSIPLLIGRYGAEEGRLKHELETALFVHTGKRCWTRSDWNKWWRKHQEGFALPHPDTVARPAAGRPSATTTSCWSARGSRSSSTTAAQWGPRSAPTASAPASTSPRSNDQGGHRAAQDAQGQPGPVREQHHLGLEGGEEAVVGQPPRADRGHRGRQAHRRHEPLRRPGVRVRRPRGRHDLPAHRRAAQRRSLHRRRRHRRAGAADEPFRARS